MDNDTGPSGLALKMLAWEQAQRRADELRAEIETWVLDLGKTQTVGNVRATFSNGRKSYDYETAGQTAAPKIIAEFTTHIEKDVIDWRLVCKKAEIADVPFTQSEPSVAVKLLA